MSSHDDRPASRSRRSRGWLTLVGIAAMLGVAVAATPAEARIDTQRQALEARVLAVRSAMRDAADAEPATPPEHRLAQWMNWGNWNNWNNWPNWGNWGNWFNR